jgi:probable HAF family extracellular repeat protein/autotransporter-associated beta strand protein
LPRHARAVLLFAIACWSPAVAVGQLAYSVVDLGTLNVVDDQTKPAASNIHGQVVLTKGVAGQNHAFRYSGSSTDLGTLGGSWSVASGIDANGSVVGTSAINATSAHAFLWTPGGPMTDLGTLGGTISEAYSINSSGAITGFSEVGLEVYRAFLYSGGTMTSLGVPLGYTDTYGYAINDAGTIVGRAESALGKAIGFIHSANTFSSIGSLGGDWTEALAINNNSPSQIVGYSMTALGDVRAVYYSDGALTNLGTLGGSSEALAINDARTIVGASFLDTNDTIPRAFVCYSAGTMSDLNASLDASGAGWTLTEATDVNNYGQITGKGTFAGQARGYVLNPVHSLLIVDNNLSAPVEFIGMTGTHSTPIAGAATVTKAGMGTLTLSGANSYTGTTTIGEGTLIVDNLDPGGNLGNGESAVVLGALLTRGVLEYTGPPAAFTRGLVINAGGGQIINNSATGELLTIATGPIAGAAGGPLTIGGTANTAIASAIALGSGGVTKSGASTLTLAGANTFAGPLSVLAGTLSIPSVNNAGAAGPLGAGTSPVVLGSNGSNAALQYTGADAAPSTNRPFTLAAASTATVQVDNPGTALTLSGVVGGSGNLAKRGPGKLALAGPNTFSGALSVLAGTLSIPSINNAGAAGPLGTATTPVTLGSNGDDVTLQYTGTDASPASSRTFTLAAGSTATFQVDNAATALTLSGAISGSGNFTKTGPGTLILAVANPYTGTTTISGGTLQAKQSEFLGSLSGTIAPLTFNGGTLKFGGQFDPSNRTITVDSGGAVIDTNGLAITFANAIGNNGSGGLTKIGANVLTLGGTAPNTFTGPITITRAVLALQKPAGVNAFASTSVTIDATTAGNNSTLQLLSDNQIPDGATVTVNNFAKFDLNGRAETIAALATTGGSPTVLLGAGTLTVGYGDANGAFSGAINGAGGGLVKIGAGTLTLSGLGNYSGATAIRAGTLSAGKIVVSGGTSNLGSAASPVALGDSSTQGTLQYTGAAATYTRGFTINAGGGRIINAGTGTLTIGNSPAGDITGSAGGSLAIGGTADITLASRLSLGSGSLTKEGSGTLELRVADNVFQSTAVQQGTLLIANPQALRAGKPLSIGPGARVVLVSGVISEAAIASPALPSSPRTDGALSVPEPGVLAMLSGAALAVAALSRRRRTCAPRKVKEVG